MDYLSSRLANQFHYFLAWQILRCAIALQDDCHFCCQVNRNQGYRTVVLRRIKLYAIISENSRFCKKGFCR